MIIIEFVDTLANQLMHIVNEVGYAAVVAITALEYACFPMMPSEVILPFIGVTAAQEKITYFGAIFSSIIGGLIGSLLCYLLGYYGGNSLIEKMKVKFPKTKGSIEVINKWFEKYGKLAVLFTRLVPLTRTYISIIAGTTKLGMTTFMLFSMIGIMIWNSILITLGYFIGYNWSYIELIMKQYSIFASVIIGIVIITAIYKRKKYKVCSK